LRIVAQPCHHDGMQGAVELAVTLRLSRCLVTPETQRGCYVLSSCGLPYDGS
jgi:hypothetical protein